MSVENSIDLLLLDVKCRLFTSSRKVSVKISIDILLLSVTCRWKFQSTVCIWQLCSHLTFFITKLSFSAKLYPFERFLVKDVRMFSWFRQIFYFLVKLWHLFLCLAINRLSTQFLPLESGKKWPFLPLFLLAAKQILNIVPFCWYLMFL